MTKKQWDINHSYEIAVRNMNPAGWAKMTENEFVETIAESQIDNSIGADLDEW